MIIETKFQKDDRVFAIQTRTIRKKFECPICNGKGLMKIQTKKKQYEIDCPFCRGIGNVNIHAGLEYEATNEGIIKGFRIEGRSSIQITYFFTNANGHENRSPENMLSNSNEQRIKLITKLNKKQQESNKTTLIYEIERFFGKMPISQLKELGPETESHPEQVYNTEILPEMDHVQEGGF